MTTAAILAWVPGFWEWIVIGVLAVLLFGRRLPEVGRSLGRGVVEFRKGLRDVQDDVTSAGKEPPPGGASQGQEKALPGEKEKPAATPEE